MPKKYRPKPPPPSDPVNITPDGGKLTPRKRLLIERVCEVVRVHPDEIEGWIRLTDGHKIILSGGVEYQIAGSRLPKE